MSSRLPSTIFVALAAAAASCGSVSGSGVGSEGAACYDNDTCNGSLVCLRDTCVALDGGTFDADPGDDVARGDIPDISGEFLLAIDPVPIAAGTLFQYIATAELGQVDGTATLSLSLQPLNASTREPVGMPLVSGSVAVSATGNFSAPIQGQIDGAANPITGEALTFDAWLDGEIRSVDSFCGDVTGALTAPIGLSLDGSTFGTIRITPGTTGAGLPQPALGECP